MYKESIAGQRQMAEREERLSVELSYFIFAIQAYFVNRYKGEELSQEKH